ncbi:MAG: autoinducer synthase [Sphingomonas bacterium]|nr:acyl-homoserine-lactone synthase [Sphingomonas bacterium]MDB5690438.1 autoinducer synthase [Sphingomonas bacterium]
MIDMISPDRRWRYAGPLMQMHRDRKIVFVDGMGWQLSAPGSWLEVDAYDNDHAVYLMARDETSGDHLGSLRLLPTTGPHLLAGVFGSLCPEGAPRADNVWEISRLVTAPHEGTPGTRVLKVHRLLALALIEFGLLNGIDHYVLVAESQRVPALLSIGWRVRPLSLPTPYDGGPLIEALQIDVDPAIGARLRERLGIASSVFVGGIDGDSDRKAA